MFILITIIFLLFWWTIIMNDSTVHVEGYSTIPNKWSKGDNNSNRNKINQKQQQNIHMIAKKADIPLETTIQRGISAAATTTLAASTTMSITTNEDEETESRTNKRLKEIKNKRIVFIRHGQTYMNEYIGGKGGFAFGAPNFTDCFPNLSKEEINMKYYDSQLSPYGIKQTKELLHDRIEKEYRNSDSSDRTDDECNSSSSSSITFFDELDLIVVSPLTRAIQTLEIGLLPHIRPLSKQCNTIDDSNNNNKAQKNDIPIIALPYAAERLYLISDLGRPRSELEKKYEYIDFETGFVSYENSDKNDKSHNVNKNYDDKNLKSPSMLFEEIWHHNKESIQTNFKTSKSNDDNDDYVEWRPNGQGQQYACNGEPIEAFAKRMNQFYQWLALREESTIAVICHHGIIDWMIQESVNNCEFRVVPFCELRPKQI